MIKYHCFQIELLKRITRGTGSYRFCFRFEAVAVFFVCISRHRYALHEIAAVGVKCYGDQFTFDFHMRPPVDGPGQ